MASAVAVIRQLKTKGLTSSEKIELAQTALADDAVYLPRKAKFLFDWTIGELLRTSSPKYKVTDGDTPHTNHLYWKFIFELIDTKVEGNTKHSESGSSSVLTLDDIQDVLCTKPVLLATIATSVECVIPALFPVTKEPTNSTDVVPICTQPTLLVKWARLCYEHLYGSGEQNSTLMTHDKNEVVGDSSQPCAPTPPVDIQVAYTTRIGKVFQDVIANTKTDEGYSLCKELYLLTYIAWGSLGAGQANQGNQKKVFSTILTKLLPSASGLLVPIVNFSITHTPEDARAIEVVRGYRRGMRSIVIDTLVRLLMHKDHIAHYMSLLAVDGLLALNTTQIVDATHKQSGKRKRESNEEEGGCDKNATTTAYTAVYTRQLFDTLLQCGAKAVDKKNAVSARSEYAGANGVVEILPALFAAFCAATSTSNKKHNPKHASVSADGDDIPTDRIRRMQWRMFKALQSTLWLSAYSPTPASDSQTNPKLNTDLKVSYGERLHVLRLMLRVLRSVKAFNPAEDIVSSSRPSDTGLGEKKQLTLSKEITMWLGSTVGMLLSVLEMFPTASCLCADETFSSGLFGTMRDAYSITPVCMNEHMARMWRLSWLLQGERTRMEGTVAWERPCALLTCQVVRTEFRMRLVDRLFVSFLGPDEAIETHTSPSHENKASASENIGETEKYSQRTKKKRKQSNGNAVPAHIDPQCKGPTQMNMTITPTLSTALTDALSDSVRDLPPGMAASVISSIVEKTAPQLKTFLCCEGIQTERDLYHAYSTLRYRMDILGVVISSTVIVDHNQALLLRPVLEIVYNSLVQPVTNAWQSSSTSNKNEGMREELVNLMTMAYNVCYHVNEAMFLCSCVSSVRYDRFRQGIQQEMIAIARDTLATSMHKTQSHVSGQKKNGFEASVVARDMKEEKSIQGLCSAVVMFLIQDVRFAESLAITLASDGESKTQGQHVNMTAAHETENTDSIEIMADLSSQCESLTATIMQYVLGQFSCQQTISGISNARTSASVDIGGSEAHSLTLWSLMSRKVAMLSKYWTSEDLSLYVKMLVRTFPALVVYEQKRDANISHISSQENMNVKDMSEWGAVTKAAVTDASFMEVADLVRVMVGCTVDSVVRVLQLEHNSDSLSTTTAIGTAVRLIRSTMAFEAKESLTDDVDVDWLALQTTSSSLTVEQSDSLFALLTGLEACPIRNMTVDILQMCTAVSVAVQICLPWSEPTSMRLRLLCRKILYKCVTSAAYRRGRERVPGFGVLSGEGLWYLISDCMGKRYPSSPVSGNVHYALDSLKRFTREIVGACLTKMLLSGSEVSIKSIETLDLHISQTVNDCEQLACTKVHSGGANGFDLEIATVYLRTIGAWIENASSSKQIKNSKVTAQHHHLFSYDKLYQKMVRHVLAILQAGTHSDKLSQTTTTETLLSNGAQQLRFISAVLNTPIPAVSVASGTVMKPSILTSTGIEKDQRGHQEQHINTRLLMVVGCLRHIAVFVSKLQNPNYTHIQEVEPNDEKDLMSTVSMCLDFLRTCARHVSVESDRTGESVCGKDFGHSYQKPHIHLNGYNVMWSRVCRAHAAAMCLSALHTHGLRHKQYGSKSALRRAAPALAAAFLNALDRVSKDIEDIDLDSGNGVSPLDPELPVKGGGLFGNGASFSVVQSKRMDVKTWKTDLFSSKNKNSTFNGGGVVDAKDLDNPDRDELTDTCTWTNTRAKARLHNHPKWGSLSATDAVQPLVGLSLACLGGLNMISSQEDIILKSDQVASIVSSLPLLPPLHCLDGHCLGSGAALTDEGDFGWHAGDDETESSSYVAVRAMLESTQPNGIESVSGRCVMISSGMLYSLLRRNTTSVLQCIHLYISALRIILWQTAYVATREAQKTSLLCAESIARLYEELSKHKVSVSKYVPHIIADYIGVVQSLALPEPVTEAISVGVYSLIGTLGPHDSSFLFARLDLAGKEIYRNLSEEYKTRHKYSGKF
eukprot:CFRG8124T1